MTKKGLPMALKPRNNGDVENTNQNEQLLKELQKINQRIDNLERNLTGHLSTNQPKHSSMNANVVNELKEQNVKLGNRMIELEQRESKHINRHNQLLKKIEASTSNFDQATHQMRDKFITVAKSYLRKIDTDNQTQDFKLAVDEKLNQVEKKTNELLSYYEASNQQSHQQWEAHKKLMDDRFKDNDKVIQKYNQSLNLMTKGITSMFFVVQSLP